MASAALSARIQTNLAILKLQEETKTQGCLTRKSHGFTIFILFFFRAQYSNVLPSQPKNSNFLNVSSF